MARVKRAVAQQEAPPRHPRAGQGLLRQQEPFVPRRQRAGHALAGSTPSATAGPARASSASSGSSASTPPAALNGISYSRFIAGLKAGRGRRRPQGPRRPRRRPSPRPSPLWSRWPQSANADAPEPVAAEASGRPDPEVPVVRTGLGQEPTGQRPAAPLEAPQCASGRRVASSSRGRPCVGVALDAGAPVPIVVPRPTVCSTADDESIARARAAAAGAPADRAAPGRPWPDRRHRHAPAPARAWSTLAPSTPGRPAGSWPPRPSADRAGRGVRPGQRRHHPAFGRGRRLQRRRLLPGIGRPLQPQDGAVVGGLDLPRADRRRARARSRPWPRWATHGIHRVGTVARGGTPLAEAALRRPRRHRAGQRGPWPARGPGTVLDELVTIPMVGRAESLNVAMAGTLVAFEAARRRGQARSDASS